MLKYIISILFSLTFSLTFSQKIYSSGDLITNFSTKKTLNYTTALTDLNSLKADITILDFFGTWCVPCVKALPGLTDLQQKFAGKLQIILISVEAHEKLQNFINKRPGFAFPVLADEDNSITALFNPPSYPYSVIMNNKNKIIAITDAGSITETMVKGWLKGKNEIIANEATQNIKEQPALLSTIMQTKTQSKNKLVLLSQNFIYAAKTSEPTKIFEDKISLLSYTDLIETLKTDDDKKAFWINIYNGFIQVLLKRNPNAYKNRKFFFGIAQILVAQKKFSLDDIEHGILRRSKVKWSLGYLNKWFPSNKEKDLRVSKLDFRLHFALNCGAKSCPPIAFYSPEKINSQLDLATKAYLTEEAQYEVESNTVFLPTLMSWFRHDFGGKKKMIILLQSLQIITADKTPRIKFKKYNWDLYLQNYQTNTNE